MEHSLITWSTRQELDEHVAEFRGVSQLRDLTDSHGKRWPVGKAWEAAVLDYELGTLDLYEHGPEQAGGPTATVRLELSVRPAVQ